MRYRPFSGVVTLLLFCSVLFSPHLEAQGSAAELIAELKSGDSTRCMDAGNATSTYQEHYQQLAAELATPLFDILENGPCSRSALTALVNVGPGIADGVDSGRAIGILVKLIEQALDENASPEAVSSGGSAVSVVGHFGPAAAPAVPSLQRWVLERSDSFDRMLGFGTLGDIGDAASSVVPALLPLTAMPAEDDEQAWEKKESRVQVARVLGAFPSAAAESAPVLVAGLGDEEYAFRSAASESIERLGAPMVPYLLPVLKEGDAEARATAVRLLGGIGEGAAGAASTIAPLLADEDWNVKFEAGEALRRIGPTPSAVAAVAKVVGHQDNEDAARAAAELLGEWGGAAKDALPTLKKAASGKNFWIAQAAKEAIAAIEGGS